MKLQKDHLWRLSSNKNQTMGWREDRSCNRDLSFLIMFIFHWLQNRYNYIRERVLNKQYEKNNEMVSCAVHDPANE